MPVPLEDQVALLGRAQERHGKRLDNHQQAIRELGDIVTSVNQKLAAKGGDDEGAPPPRVCWLTVDDPDVAELAMQDLETWLQQVYVQYGHWLPACWAWHPWIVEELLALRHAHWAAYSDKAGPQAAIDWHEKALPGVAKRIAAATAKAHTLDDHRGGNQLVPMPLPGSAARVTGAWAQRGADWSFTGPEPTDWEINAADAHRARYARGGGRTA